MRSQLRPYLTRRGKIYEPADSWEKKKSNLNCTGLIPCCCLFQNASLMSLHGLNKSQSCLICIICWKIVILVIWGKREIYVHS